MACVEFPKGSREWAMIAEFWILCKKYWIVENTDEWWEEVIVDADAFWKKYRDMILPRMLADSLIGFLEYKRNMDLKIKEDGNEKH